MAVLVLDGAVGWMGMCATRSKMNVGLDELSFLRAMAFFFVLYCVGLGCKNGHRDLPLRKVHVCVSVSVSVSVSGMGESGFGL
jgi:hypothetical protein